MTNLAAREGETRRGTFLFLKRLTDLVGGFVLLVVAVPVFIMVTFAVVATSRGPVFFRQTRVGLEGRTFRVIKFRTMRADAESSRFEVETLNITGGPTFKAPDDPRVTRVGRLLRKTSLDELPQLWHVVRGDMSLVGPRPLDAAEVARMPVAIAKLRHSVKPGLTCIWQVSGRSTIRFDDWMRMDLEYVNRQSMACDLLLLARTPWAVISGRGAL